MSDPQERDYSPEALERLVLERERLLDEGAQPFADAPHPIEAIDDEPVVTYRLTELGNAERFAEANARTLRYVQDWKAWLSWDGRCWRRDRSGAENEAAKRVVEELFRMADEATSAADLLSREFADVLAAAESGERSARSQARSSKEFEQTKRARVTAEAITAWAMTSSSARVIAHMPQLARSEPRLVAAPSDFDSDAWTMNVQNGTLDLRRGELRPHRQEDMNTRLADVRYDPEATAPRWERFLEQIHPQPEMRAWLQRFFGYSLTGSVDEQVMLFALGGGANGKNVLFDTLLAIMGDYAMVAAPDLLVLKHNDEHPTAFADLQGHRLVVVSEIDRGRRWAEATIKRLTGDKRVKARRMRQDFYEFEASHKFAVMANNKPEVQGTDHGIWRRFVLVPFNVTIAAADRDTELPLKLLEEREGIFAWAVRGCMAWQREGLGSAAAISDAVAEYRQEQDVVGEWISERCLCVCQPHDQRWRDDGFCAACGASVQPRLVVDGEPREPWASLYPDFRAWQEGAGLRPWSKPAFRAEILTRRWLRAYRTAAERGVSGIKLRYPTAPGAGWTTRPDYQRPGPDA